MMRYFATGGVPLEMPSEGKGRVFESRQGRQFAAEGKPYRS
jgi:hypothetical protein